MSIVKVVLSLTDDATPAVTTKVEFQPVEGTHGDKSKVAHWTAKSKSTLVPEYQKIYTVK